MNLDITAVVQESRDLLEEMKCAEALATIDAIQKNTQLTVHETMVIAYEKALHLNQQGYVFRAGVALREVLNASIGQTMSKEGKVLQDLLRGMEALMMMETNGVMEQGLRVREELKGLYLSSDISKICQDDLQVVQSPTCSTD
jgi:hypothetical protein